MERTTLGGLDVSAVSLGTMTFRHDMPMDDSFAQLDRALDAGITLIDTAEMYPVNPASAESHGDSERVIGAWLAQDTARRARVQVATKISGTGGNGRFSRDNAGFEPGNIADAVDGSLRRLGVEVIDLYQLHWPKRGSYAFRQNWTFDPRGSSKARVEDHMAGIAEAMKSVVAAGKVREFGLSNESAWGTMRWLDAAKTTGGPRPVSVQNEYSALYRLHDTDLAEVGQKENVTLLAFSPLATGLLSGKYSGGALPPASRAADDLADGGTGQLGGRRTPRALDAADAWVALARDRGLDPLHMAIAFIRQRPFPVIPILGASTVQQLDHLIAGLDLRLDDETLAAIDRFHRAHPLPY